MFYVYVFTEQRFYSKLSRAIPVGLWIMIRNARLRLHVLLLLFLQTLNKIVQFSRDFHKVHVDHIWPCSGAGPL